jgi:hypothetical protein
MISFAAGSVQSSRLSELLISGYITSWIIRDMFSNGFGIYSIHSSSASFPAVTAKSVVFRTKSAFFLKPSGAVSDAYNHASKILTQGTRPCQNHLNRLAGCRIERNRSAIVQFEEILDTCPGAELRSKMTSRTIRNSDEISRSSLHCHHDFLLGRYRKRNVGLCELDIGDEEGPWYNSGNRAVSARS